MKHNTQYSQVGIEMKNLLKVLFILGLALITIIAHILIWMFYHPNKYIDQPSLLNIETYIRSQSIHLEHHNTYGLNVEYDLGLAFLSSGIIVHSNNEEEWLKKKEVLHINVQPVVNDQLYRVILRQIIVSGILSNIG